MNFNVKYVDLSVHLNSFCVDISKDFIKELNLEYGSTYSFLVSYGKPLSFKGLAYNSLKLTMEDIKEGPLTIKSSIFYSRNLPLSYKSNGMISFGMKGKVIKYEELLYMCIWSLVSRSDIVKGIIENRHYRVSDNNTSIFGGKKDEPTFITPNVPGHDVINMSLACCKITKDDLVIEKSNIILINI